MSLAAEPSAPGAASDQSGTGTGAAEWATEDMKERPSVRNVKVARARRRASGEVMGRGRMEWGGNGGGVGAIWVERMRGGGGGQARKPSPIRGCLLKIHVACAGRALRAVSEPVSFAAHR